MSRSKGALVMYASFAQASCYQNYSMPIDSKPTFGATCQLCCEASRQRRAAVVNDRNFPPRALLCVG